MSHLSRAEVVILKPLSILYVCAALFFLFNRSWLVAVWMIVASFVIGVIGASLHPSKTTAELSRGTITPDWAAPSPVLSHSESFELAKLICWLVTIGGITGIVLSRHYGYNWLASVGIGAAASVLMAIGCILVVLVKRRPSVEEHTPHTPPERPRILLAIARETGHFAAGLTELLRSWGYASVAASGIAEVKKQLQTSTYDLLVLDLCDSDFDLPPNDLLRLHPRILFLVCEDLHIRRVPPGSLALVGKPVDVQDLFRKLREMLPAGKTALSGAANSS
jgi:hypothetical protein